MSRKYDFDSHFQILIPLCTDSIFNTPRPKRSKPIPFARIERVHRLDEPDGADGDELLLLVSGDVVLLHDVGDQPQIVEDERVPCSGISLRKSLEKPFFFRRAQRLRKRALVLNVESEPEQTAEYIRE